MHLACSTSKDAVKFFTPLSNRTSYYEGLNAVFLRWYIHWQDLYWHWHGANTVFFLVRIFPYSVRIWENTDQKKFQLTPFAQWNHEYLKIFLFLLSVLRLLQLLYYDIGFIIIILDTLFINYLSCKSTNGLAL